MGDQVLAIKKGRRWVAVTVSERQAQVTASAKQGGRNYVNGTGSRSIEKLLATSLATYPTLKQLKEENVDVFTDECLAVRASEYDV